MALIQDFRKMIFTLFIILFIVFFTLSPSGLIAQQIPKEAEIHNTLGNSYCDKGEFNKAVKEYEEAVVIYPQYIDAYYNLGVTYYHDLKDFQKAAYYFQKFLELESGSVDAQAVKGWLSEIEKSHGIKPPAKLESQEQKLAKAEVSPPPPPSYAKPPSPISPPPKSTPPPPPGSFQPSPPPARPAPPPLPMAKQGDKQVIPLPVVEEKKDMEKDILQLALRFKEQGNKYSKEGKYDLAVREYQEALKIRPGYTDALFNLARTYDKNLKDKENAVKYYEEFLKYEKPNSRDARYVKRRLPRVKEELEEEKAKAEKELAKAEKPPEVMGEPCGTGIKPFGARYDDLPFTRDLVEEPVEIATLQPEEKKEVKEVIPPPPVEVPVPPKLNPPVDTILLTYFMPQGLRTTQTAVLVRNEMRNELNDIFKDKKAKDISRLTQIFLTKMQREYTPKGDEIANVTIPGILLANIENVRILDHKDMYELNNEKRDLLRSPKQTEKTKKRLDEIEKILEDGYEIKP